MDLSDPWYGDILVYLQTQRFRSLATKDDRRRIIHLAQHYLIVGDALYHRGVDTMLRQCGIHKEAEMIMNDCHSGGLWWSSLRACYSPKNIAHRVLMANDL